MNIVQAKRALPYLLKFGGAAAMGMVTSTLANTDHVNSILGADAKKAFGLPGVAELLQLTAGIVSDKAGKYVDDALRQRTYGFNGDLQKAFDEALALAIGNLMKQYKQAHPDADHGLARLFFAELAEAAKLPTNLNEATMHQLADAYVQDRRQFLLLLQGVAQIEVSADASTGQILQFLAAEFPAAMEHAFLEQLKGPEHEKARISYTIYLSEEAVRLAKDNEAGLQELQHLLESLGRRQQLNLEQNDNIRQLLQKLEDELRQRRYNDTQTHESLLRLEEQSTIALHLPRVEVEEKQLFVYKADYTDFLGREAEIKQLDEFARYNGNRFAWLLMTGPGGVGKSRLALHYCRQLKTEGFEAGFLSTESLLTVNTIRFKGPTLLVIDYVAAYASHIADAIVQLHRRNEAGKLSAPVRLLLLERDAQGEWWKQFEKAEVWTCRFRLPGTDKPVLPLPGLSSDDHWQLISDIYKKRRGGEEIPYERDAVLRELYRLDPQRRPLFALFVSVALADGYYTSLQTWGAHDLLDRILQRERGVWTEHKAYKKKELNQHQNLLALSTLTKGLSHKAIRRICGQTATSREWLPKTPDRDLYNHISQVRLATAEDASVLAEEEPQQPNDYGDTPEMWLGLQPDILGEYFLLTRIAEWIRNSGSADEMVALVQTAWETHPTATRDFLEKTLLDYKEMWQSGAYRLLLEIKPKAGTRMEAWFSWGWLQLSGTANPFAAAGAAATSEYYYEKLLQESPVQAGDSYLFLFFLQASAIYNLVTIYCLYKQQPLQAEYYYTKLQALAQEWTGTLSVTERLAAAANNLIALYIRAGEKYWPEAKRHYDELYSLAQEWSKALPVVEWYANATVGMVAINSGGSQEYWTKVDLPEAERYYAKLQALAQEWPTALSIVNHLAKAVYNLVSGYSHNQDWPNAEYHYTKLQLLAQEWPGALIITESLASATNNLIAHYGSAGEKYWPEAKRHYDELHALAQEWSGALPVVEQLAKATAGLIADYSQPDYWSEAEHYYVQLQILVQSWADELLVADDLALAARNIIIAYSRHKRWPDAERYYRELHTLAQAWPRSLSIVEELAKAGTNMVIDYSREAIWPEAERHYAELKALAWLKVLPLAEQLAMATNGLIANYMRAGQNHWLTAEHHYAEIQGLLDIWPEAQSVAEPLAMAACNLAIAYSRTGPEYLPAAELHYADLQALTYVWSVVNMAEWLAYAAYELVTAYAVAGQEYWSNAESHYAELQLLAEAWPESLPVAEHLSTAAYNLVTIYSKKGYWPEAERHYAELLRLAESWPRSLSIVEALAKAGANMVIDYSRETIWSDAERHCTDLQVLTEAWSEADSVVEWIAMATNNLIQAYAVAGQKHWPDAKRYYTALQTLAKARPDALPVATWLAAAANNLVVNYSQNQCWIEAAQHHNELQILVQTWPKSLIVAEQLAKATVSILWGHNEAQHWKHWEANEQYYSQLRILAQVWRGEPRIAVRLAYAAKCMTQQFSLLMYKIDILEKASSYYRDWLIVHKQFPDDITWD